MSAAVLSAIIVQDDATVGVDRVIDLGPGAKGCDDDRDLAPMTPAWHWAMTNSSPEQMNIGDATTGNASGVWRISGSVDTARVSSSVDGVGRLVCCRVDPLLREDQQTCDCQDWAADQQDFVPAALVGKQRGDPRGLERHAMDRTAPAD
jgi:hypothetical protein